MEHIVARQHGGKTEESNLAWSCQRCNAQKGPNLRGIDPDTGAVVALFHPRHGQWTDHFKFSALRIEGITATGRATAWLLEFNSEERLLWRATLQRHGLL
jgi:hypothetical protein